LSKLIDNPILAKYGKYTFPIYAFHLSFVFVGNAVFSHLPQMICYNKEMKALFVGTITLIISCLLIPFIKKIDSNLIGEHR
jgi:peptidoglycan/LPS O-acetylase OafA/YrhL